MLSLVVSVAVKAKYSVHKIIRILQECEVLIEKTVPMVTVWHHEAYSPKARFINDNFHHSQPLPENHNFSAITLIWKNLTWKIPTNPTTFNIEKSAVIFRFNLGQLCRVQAYM